MIPPVIAVTLLAASCLVLGMLGMRRRANGKRGFVEIAPGYRSFFRQIGVTEAAHFLDLPGPTPHIVSGHPDRNVARVTIQEGEKVWVAYLKREHRVRWRTRLGNALAGFGFLSRSLREARTLQMLQREGLPGPEWLAAGEDGVGRAFLLVREIEGSELRTALCGEPSRTRRRIARKLGATLARLHTAGFRHQDLYANHVFIHLPQATVHLLDWQRARLRHTLSWQDRERDLAALHATVDDALATAEERLICLRAYWRACSPLFISWPAAVRRVEAHARQLRTRRHISEKRHPPAQPQAWICLEGEALCVTPVLQERYGHEALDCLRSHADQFAADHSLIRRWPTLTGSTRTLLVRRNEHPRKTWTRSRRNSGSPEHRQASLLLRLERHGIAAPQVLALSRRQAADGRVESILLTEPFADTCSLEAWIARRTRQRHKPNNLPSLWSVLRQTGAFLKRLHEASCYLDMGSAGCGLAVRQTDGKLEVVLDRVEGLTPRRRRQPRRARRDLQRLRLTLRAAGCSRTDLCRFRLGYRQKEKANGWRQPVDIGHSPEASGVGVVQSLPTQRDTLWRRLLLGVRRLHQRCDWPRFAGADWAERIMDVTVTDRFHAKQGRSTGRWILHRSDAPTPLAVYLKRHYEVPWWQAWLATLWRGHNRSPSGRECRHLEWARQRGLPVPRTVAVAEFIGPWGKLQSALAIEELAGMMSLQEAIPLAALRQDAAAFRLWKRELTAEMARLTRMLHDRRCFHKDLYLCHFFIARDDTRSLPTGGWRGRVHLIDMHRLAHHPVGWRIWQTKDLAQLLYASAIVGIDARDRLAFWRAYRGEGPHRPPCSWVRRFVLYRGRRYRQHNTRYLQGGQDA
jgi:heptose I phosphotransferase